MKAKSQTILTAVAKLQVRFNECDPLGIVWHGNYAKFFEDGREAFCDKYGLDYWSIYINGHATPIVHMEANFKKTLKYKDIALVETTMRHTHAAKIIFDYAIKNEKTNELICNGTTTQVFVNSGNMQLALTSPDTYLNWKKQNGI